MSDEQQTPADAMTERAIEAHVTGQTEKAAPLFKAAEAAHERAAPPEQTGPDPGWRDGNELAPMPPAPAVTRETDAALAKFTNLGGEHAALVKSWGSDAPANVEYARAAFREMAASDPGLIDAVERSGIGNNPLILDHLARFGRLSAGRSGDRTIERRNDVTHSPRASAKPRANSSAQNELNDLLDANPPGSPSYKSRHVQDRVETLSRMIAGSGNAVGVDGRTA